MACVNLREPAAFALDAFGPKFDAGVTAFKRVTRESRSCRIDSISSIRLGHRIDRLKTIVVTEQGTGGLRCNTADSLFRTAPSDQEQVHQRGHGDADAERDQGIVNAEVVLQIGHRLVDLGGHRNTIGRTPQGPCEAAHI